ncbi:hypothetical protein [Paeniglutamicibacter kerguelensis]
MSFFRKEVPLWRALLTGLCIAVVFGLAAVGALRAPQGMLNFLPFSNNSESRNSQVIDSLTREEQVVLLSLGIQGISEKNGQSNFFGIEVPGSSRVSLIQYGFKAKLGFDGKDVKYESSGDKILISFPKFIFIGHDDETFRLVTENNGVLSWITPEIDAVEMVNNILSDEAKDQYIDSNEADLKDQTSVYYKNIVQGIDSDIEVELKFRN